MVENELQNLRQMRQQINSSTGSNGSYGRYGSGGSGSGGDGRYGNCGNKRGRRGGGYGIGSFRNWGNVIYFSTSVGEPEWKQLLCQFLVMYSSDVIKKRT